MHRRIGILLTLATIACALRLMAGGLAAPTATIADAAEPAVAPATRPSTIADDIVPAAEAASPPAGSSPKPEAISGASLLDEAALLDLRARQKALDDRAARLEERERLIRKAEASLRARIQQLEQLEASIRQRLDEEASIKNKKIKRLAAVYAAMKPERAAPVVARMELGTVVRIFLLMDEKRVGKILSFLPPEQAVRISQALTRNLAALR
ncbi:MAG: hypothetical protein R8K47_02320 [Mariprofundaceae bacterium]